VSAQPDKIDYKVCSTPIFTVTDYDNSQANFFNFIKHNPLTAKPGDTLKIIFIEEIYPSGMANLPAHEGTTVIGSLTGTLDFYAAISQVSNAPVLLDVVPSTQSATIYLPYPTPTAESFVLAPSSACDTAYLELTINVPSTLADGTYPITFADLTTFPGGTADCLPTAVIVSKTTPPPSCSDYTDQLSCLSHGCYWWPSDNKCHSSPPSQTCEDYTDETTCNANSCYWYNGSCHTSQQQTTPSFLDQILAILTNKYVLIGGASFLALLALYEAAK